jgi:hypothetical protein
MAEGARAVTAALMAKGSVRFIGTSLRVDGRTTGKLGADPAAVPKGRLKSC